MGKICISTKANTLFDMKPVLENAKIEDMMIIKVSDFIRYKDIVIHNVVENFDGDFIVVRSSSVSESQSRKTDESEYVSIMNINSKDKEVISKAVQEVLDSYVKKTELNNDVLEFYNGKSHLENELHKYESVLGEQILIQRQSKDIIKMGVIHTRDIEDNLPYYVIKYNQGVDIYAQHNEKYEKKVLIARNVGKEFISGDFVSLIKAVNEIENLVTNAEYLEIKFGIDKRNDVIIYSVRPLFEVINRKQIMTDREFMDTKALAKCGYLDHFAILSDKAVWNPAKHIGNNPRPLDYSLYSELLMKGIWSSGISKLGYQYVENSLMERVGNKPYVSVENAFDGLTPANLPHQFRYRLNSYYKKKLKENNSLHDKLERQVIFNTYDFSTNKRLKELYNEDFSEEEIKILGNRLYKLTTNAVKNHNKVYEKDFEATKEMKRIRHEIRACNFNEETNIMKLHMYIQELYDSIKEYGTQQFARFNRYAFMARSFCESLVEQGYFTNDEIHKYLSAIPTIAYELKRDFASYIRGEMTIEELNVKYGHLRLGTYDIRTDGFSHIFADIAEYTEKNFDDNIEEVFLNRKRLEKAISDSVFDFTAEELDIFVKSCIKNREFFKFEFTKSLSLMLDIVIRLGDVHGIAKEDMSYLEIDELLSYHSRDAYIQLINSRRYMYHSYYYLVLPSVIFGVGDIDVIDVNTSEIKPVNEFFKLAEAAKFDAEIKNIIKNK